MDTSWTSKDLASAVNYYLQLLKSQRDQGSLSPEGVCAALAQLTGHAEADARAVMNTLSWLLSAQGARLCKGFPPQCDAGEETVMRLEQVLIRDMHIRRRLRLAPWTVEETSAAVECYRRMLEDGFGGRPFSTKDRIAELAISIPRTYASVKRKLCQISWLLGERGVPLVPGLPSEPIAGRKTASLLESLAAVLDAFKGAGGRRPWTEPELEEAVQTYQKLAGLEVSGSAYDPADSVCDLARQTGRRFSDCSLCLSSIVSLRRSLGLAAISCVPEGEGLPRSERQLLEQVCRRMLSC